MENKKDFFNGDALEIIDYIDRQKKSNNNYNVSFIAKYFKDIFDNKENRKNKSEALKIIVDDLVGSRQSYKSIIAFKDEIKDLFKEFDKYEDSKKYKSLLINFKEHACLNDFKKTAKKDLELLNSGEINNKSLNIMVDSIFLIKDAVNNDENASSILNDMLLNNSFKISYEQATQRSIDIKELKNNILDNSFEEWVSGMGDFYGIKPMTKIPTGDTRSAIEYRENVIPEIDKMVVLLDKFNTNKNTLKKASFDASFTIEEQEKMERLFLKLEEYKENKSVYESKNGLLNNKEMKNFKINDSSEVYNDIKYKDDLKFFSLQYNNIIKGADRFTVDQQINEMTMLKSQIDKLPIEVSSMDDQLLITDLKYKIKNDDYILLDNFNNATKNIDSLKSNGLLNGGRLNIENINGDNYIERDLKQIEDMVDSIDKKYGSSYSPLFNDIDKFKFMEYKQISDTYKKHKIQELKLDIKIKQ